MANTAENMDLTPEEIEEKLVADFSYYAPRCLKIQTMEGLLVPFELNEPQMILEQIIRELEAEGLLVRLLILKARREGVSTYTEGRFYWKTSTRFNRYAVTVTHEPDATDFLFKMTKRFYQHTPPDFKPTTKYSNMKLLEFNNDKGTGLDSAFRVGTAAKDDLGSGQLIHYLHMSEVAKWPSNNQKDILTSLLQCVPDEPDTEIVFESTAKGIGGEFYNRFWAARYRYEVVLVNGKPVVKKSVNPDADPQNAYCAVFLPWFVFNKYRAVPPVDFKRKKKEDQTNPDKLSEEEMANLYGLDDHQLYWRRLAIENRCGGSEDVFAQEYPSNPQEAFLSSGRPVFDNAKLVILKKNAPKPVQRYECLLTTGQWIAKADGRLLVWEEPVPGRSYVIGADVAEGLAHGDFSNADVLDHLTGRQVAQWHGHMDPDQYGKLLYWLGFRYNAAWIAVERNNHGLTTVTSLCNAVPAYPRIYAEMVPEPPGKPRKRYGWLTSSVTRPLIIDGLVEAMREAEHGIVCAETFAEMMSFKIQDDGKMEADEGMFDDRVMSVAIAKHIRRTIPVFKSGTNPTTGLAAVNTTRTRKPPRGAFT